MAILMLKIATRVLAGLAGLGIAVLVGLCLLGAAQKPDTRLPPGLRGVHVTVDGIPIRYVQGGRGSDVLLLHGSPGSVEDWEAVFPRLAERFRVTAIDRPGHGYSGGADRPHTPQANAAVALGVIRALRLEHVTVVGHSFGGATALALALEDPPEVRSIVVAGSRAYPPVPVEPLYRLLALPWIGPGIGAAIAPSIGEGKVDAGVRVAFGVNADAMPAGFVAARTKLWTRPTITTSLSLERVAFESALATMAPHYREIRKPTFVVYGAADARAAADGPRLGRDVPVARLVALPDTGHYVQYARPEALIHVIEQAAATP
jgi:pimeloyl-ACP methyl ester carboxylesterase